MALFRVVYVIAALVSIGAAGLVQGLILDKKKEDM